MRCKGCKSDLVASINGKTSDLCYVSIPSHGVEHDGYVPGGLGIGGGDYLYFDVCLDCGLLQGKFPVVFDAIDELKENRSGAV